MKRALSILGVIGITALITYLAISNHLSQARADRLDKALMDAEARVVQLESDIEAARQQLAQLTRDSENGRPPISALRTRQAPPVSQSAASDSSPNAGTVSPPSGDAGGSATAVRPVPVAVPSGSWTRFVALPTSTEVTNLVRIEGTSSIHNWQVEGHLIGGSAEVGPGFPPRPGNLVEAEAVDARVNVFIPVRSLKSVEQDGSPYSSQMDEVMYEKMRESSNKRITYTLTSLTAKERSRDATGPLLYDATGNLAVAGVTNTLSMTVSVTPTSSGKIQFTGSVRIKMTDFQIKPPSPSFGGVTITTGDEVTLRFAWWANRLGSVAAAK